MTEVQFTRKFRKKLVEKICTPIVVKIAVDFGLIS